MQTTVHFTLTNRDGSESSYSAEINKIQEKLLVTVFRQDGGKEGFEVLRENGEIIVNTKTVSIILTPEKELYKQLQKIGEKYL